MPNLEEGAASSWLAAGDPTKDTSSDPLVRLVERDPVVQSVLEALGTDLDDAQSRDPDGFFRTLRDDAWRLALHDLLAGLGRARVMVLLDWIARAGGASPIASLDGIVRPYELLGLRLMRQDRRQLFDRLLSPGRLLTLLQVCAPEQHQETV